jgi:hypothetical protein
MVIAGLVALLATVQSVAAQGPWVAGLWQKIDQETGKTGVWLSPVRHPQNSAKASPGHTAPRELAAGKNSWALTEFLRGHYTTSRDQAAALAAYVFGRDHAVAASAPGQDTKPPAKRAKQKEAASPGDIFQRLFNLIIPRPTAAVSRRKEPKAPKPSRVTLEPAPDTHNEPPAAVAQPVGSVTPEPAADTDEPAVAGPRKEEVAAPVDTASVGSVTPEPTADTHDEPTAAVAQPAGSVTSEPTAGTDEPAVAGPRKEEVAAPVDTALPNSCETTPVPRDDVPD